MVMKYSSAYRAKKKLRWILPLLGVLLIAALAAAAQLPGIKSRLAWRVEVASTYLRGVVNPIQSMPAPHEVSAAAAPDSTPTFTPPAPPILPHRRPRRKNPQHPHPRPPRCRGKRSSSRLSMKSRI